MMLIFRDEQLSLTWGVGADRTKGHRPWREDLLYVTKLEGMKEYIRLAAPSMLFLGMEGAAFDGTVMVSGYMGPTYAAAWTILLQLQSSGWSSTYGISTGVAARIGNALGENRPLQAKRFAQKVSIALVTLASGFNSMVFLALHQPILYLFTDDPTEQMYEIVPYIPLMHMSDCIQFVFQGIYAGAGKNHIGSPILLFFLWVIGLPLGALLATKGGMTLLGLLLGMSIAMVIEIPVFIYFMNHFNWPMMASKASRQPLAGVK
jgi:MATE family multidrug resistance protein